MLNYKIEFDETHYQQELKEKQSFPLVEVLLRYFTKAKELKFFISEGEAFDLLDMAVFYSLQDNEDATSEIKTSIETIQKPNDLTSLFTARSKINNLYLEYIRLLDLSLNRVSLSLLSGNQLYQKENELIISLQKGELSLENSIILSISNKNIIEIKKYKNYKEVLILSQTDLNDVNETIHLHDLDLKKEVVYKLFFEMKVNYIYQKNDNRFLAFNEIAEEGYSKVYQKDRDHKLFLIHKFSQVKREVMDGLVVDTDSLLGLLLLIGIISFFYTIPHFIDFSYNTLISLNIEKIWSIHSLQDWHQLLYFIITVSVTLLAVNMYALSKIMNIGFTKTLNLKWRVMQAVSWSFVYLSLLGIFFIMHALFCWKTVGDYFSAGKIVYVKYAANDTLENSEQAEARVKNMRANFYQLKTFNELILVLRDDYVPLGLPLTDEKVKEHFEKFCNFNKDSFTVTKMTESLTECEHFSGYTLIFKGAK